MNKAQLGARIKQARIDRDYTQDQLASAIGVNKSTISRYECGEFGSPKIPVIDAIANELHVNPAWLIGKSDDKTYTPPNSDFSLYSPCNLFKPLKTLRNAQRLSLEDVAYRIGISKEDYAAIENGCNTDCITLARIAMFYCCSTDFALSFDGILNEEIHVSFTKNIILRLHESFMNLTEDEQLKVIEFSEDLLKKHEA